MDSLESNLFILQSCVGLGGGWDWKEENIRHMG